MVGTVVRRRGGVALLAGLVLAMIVLSAPASAAAPWTETRLTREHWYSSSASAVDGQGRVHLAARRSGAGAGVRYLRPQGGDWVERPVAPDAHAGLVAIALDPAGRPVIAWSHGRRQIRIATPVGDGWAVERIPAGTVVGERLVLALDGDGHRHLAWFRDGDSRLHYATDRGGTWWRTSAGPVDTYGSPALAVTRDGVAWLAAAMERRRGFGLRPRIRAIRIEDRTVTTNRLGDGFDPLVVLDDGERPVVSWSGKGLRFRTFNGGHWEPATILRRYAFPVYGLDIRGDRIAVAYDAWEGGVSVVQRTASGPWATTALPHWWACVPTALHLVGSSVLLPCRGWGRDPAFVPPGISIRVLRAAGMTIRSVAPELRYPTVLPAQAPDGHLEILAVGADGSLVLHRQTPQGWIEERLPSMGSAPAAAFTIGPGGDRAIVGQASGSRLILATDRGGTWRRSTIGTGFEPQIGIDPSGRYHVGYVRRDGPRRTLWVAVGKPGAWRRSKIPGSKVQADEGNPVFMVAPDGSDAVVWKRSANIDREGGGIRLARSGRDGWSVRRLGNSWYAQLWSAAMAPDGSIGIVRGGLLNNRLQTIRGDERSFEELPGVTFFGGTLIYDNASRPAVLAVGWDLGRLQLLRRLDDGWRRTTVIRDRWEEAQLAMTGDGPAVIIGRHPDRGRDAGWWVLTRPS